MTSKRRRDCRGAGTIGEGNGISGGLTFCYFVAAMQCLVYRPFAVAVVCLLLLPSCSWAFEPEEIWDRVNPSVLRVEATLLDGEEMQGSGFACEVEGKKYVLSNRHVVAGAKQIRVGHSTEKLSAAPGFRISPELDLALIDLPTGMQIPVLRKRATELRVGERVYAVGFPLGLNKSISQGLLSSQTEKVVQFDAAISSGSSGGPLIDKDGFVVGIVTAGSVNSTDQIAQNLNFAIKIAHIPKLNLFQDPIVSFYDAWRQVVRIENTLIDGLAKTSVLEVHDYLQKELAAGILREERKAKGVLVPFEADQAEALKKIVQKHGSIEKASQKAVAYLKNRIPEFDTLPELFIALGRQELLKEFTQDRRPGGLFRLKVDESDIAPLLRASLIHVRAKYEDTAYQIDYLHSILPKLRNADPAFLGKLRNLDDRLRNTQRTSVRLDYASLGKAPSDDERFLWFGKTLIPYQPANADPTILERRVEKKLSAREEFTYYGGFEQDIATMFQRLAIAQVQSGNLPKALGYLRNDVSVRRFGDYRLLAHFTAASGDFDKAYKLYQKAFNDSAEMFDPFTLEKDGKMRRFLIVDELQEDGERFHSYPAVARTNLMEWHRFLFRKGALALSNLPTLDEALTSKAFHEATEFERYFVLHSFQTRALAETNGGFEKFHKAVMANPIANRLYAKYF